MKHYPTIHERFLRHIWSKQYLQSAELQTVDGRTVTVLNTGTLNTASGADFNGAKVRIGGITYTGDVEIHRTADDWRKHGHQTDPRYNTTILHVVLEGKSSDTKTIAASGRTIPVLVLEPFLPQSLREIWHKTILDERTTKVKTIPCSGKNDSVTVNTFDTLLKKLSTERLELKIRRFDERLKELAEQRIQSLQEPPRTYGEPPIEGAPEEVPLPSTEMPLHMLSRKEFWEQLVYEGIMEGLGYRKNREPFLKLARKLHLAMLKQYHVADTRNGLEGALYGAAGLIPSPREMKEKESRVYASSLQQEWDSLRPLLRVTPMEQTEWHFFPTRPRNFPTLRIAAAASLIERLCIGEMFRDANQILKSPGKEQEKTQALEKLFTVKVSDFWLTHYNFDSSSPSSLAALGRSRIHDIIINTLIPVTLLHARKYKDRNAREAILKYYRNFPPLSENSITQLIETQLFKSKGKLDGASDQQGAIQLYKFYCSEGRCKECLVEKRIKF